MATDAPVINWAYSSTNIVKGNNKYCGRYLNPDPDQDEDEVVCCKYSTFQY